MIASTEWFREVHRLRAGRALMLLTGMVLLTLSVRTSAQGVSVEEMQALVDAHGAEVLVKVLMDARNGQMSIEQGGHIKEMWGRPRLDLVSAASLSHDAGKAGLDLASLREELSQFVTLESEAHERLTGQGGTHAVIPLASFDPDLEVWTPSGTWTVHRLMEDAERHRKDWPPEMNELRQREAFRRNNRVEQILLAWQARYGTSSMREVERLLLVQVRDRMNQCRRLNKRRQKSQWGQLDCDNATRPGVTRVGKQLKALLRRPFDDYKAAVNAGLQSLR